VFYREIMQFGGGDRFNNADRAIKILLIQSAQDDVFPTSHYLERAVEIAEQAPHHIISHQHQFLLSDKPFPQAFHFVVNFFHRRFTDLSACFSGYHPGGISEMILYIAENTVRVPFILADIAHEPGTEESPEYAVKYLYLL